MKDEEDVEFPPFLYSRAQEAVHVHRCLYCEKERNGIEGSDHVKMRGKENK
jgi:hypothetical protein